MIIIASKRFGELTVIDLVSALRPAAVQGNLAIVKAIIASNRFIDIPAQYLGDALCGAAEGRNSAIVTVLLASNRLGEIPVYYFGEVLYIASYHRQLDIVNAIIACNRFRELSTNCVMWALLKAADNGHSHIVNNMVQNDKVIKNDRFLNNGENSLEDSLLFFAQHYNFVILHALFIKISLWVVLKTFSTAVWRRELNVLTGFSLFFACSFQKIVQNFRRLLRLPQIA